MFLVLSLEEGPRKPMSYRSYLTCICLELIQSRNTKQELYPLSHLIQWLSLWTSCSSFNSSSCGLWKCGTAFHPHYQKVEATTERYFKT